MTATTYPGNRTPFGPLDSLTDLPLLSMTTECADPQAVYRRWEREWGRSTGPVWLEPGVPAWLVHGYREIRSITENDRLFSHNPHNWRQYADGQLDPNSGLGAIMFPRPNCYYADGEEHLRLRRPLVDAFAMVNEESVRQVVAGICRDLLAPHLRTRSVDLVADYAQPVPMLVVAALFGLPGHVRAELTRAMAAVFSAGPEAQAGMDTVQNILAGTLADHAIHRRLDLTTAILEHPSLSDDFERLQLMNLTLTAGWQTTSTWIAQSLRILLTDPRFAARIQGGRLSVEDALDEVLWRDPPMANMPARYAMADTVIAGQPIRAGDPIIVAFAAGNHDPLVHTDARQPGSRAHLAWGLGAHRCVAIRIAEAITRIAVRTVMDILQDVTLTIAPENVGVMPSPWTRCPGQLPVSFIPARSPLTAAPGPAQHPLLVSVPALRPSTVEDRA